MSQRKIFLDTNIVLDYVLARKDFVEPAQKIFLLHELEEIEIFVSALTLANVAYVVEKNGRDPFQVIRNLIKWVKIIPLQNFHFQKVLSSSFKDFEDGLQNFSAEDIPGIEAIITRDLKGFKPSTIPVFSSNDFVKLFSKIQ